MTASLPQNGALNYKPDSGIFDTPRYNFASTQTPPEFAPSEDEPQLSMLINLIVPKMFNLHGLNGLLSQPDFVPLRRSSVPVRLYGG